MVMPLPPSPGAIRAAQLPQLSRLLSGDVPPQPVVDIGELSQRCGQGSQIPKSFPICDSDASPLRATATTSRQNSVGKAFGVLVILQRGRILTGKESTQLGQSLAIAVQDETHLLARGDQPGSRGL